MKNIPIIRRTMDLSYTELMLWFPGGASQEQPAESGFAHFSEHLIFKIPVNGERLADRIEQIGGEINAYTSMDFVAVTITVTNKQVPEALDILGAVCSADMSAIDEREFDEERNVVIEEKLMYHDDPTEKLFLAVKNTCYGDHPYGRDILGDVDVLKNASRDDLSRFFRDVVRRAPFLSCVGGYDGDVSFALPTESGPVNAPPFSRNPSRQTLLLTNRQEKHYLIAAHHVPVKSIREKIMLSLVRTMTYTLDSARFYNDLIYDRRVFDELSMHAMNGRDVSCFIQTAAFSGEERTGRINSWLDAWNRCDFSEKEFARAREVLVSQKEFSADDPRMVSDILGRSYNRYGSETRLEELYYYHMNTVTLDEVSAFKRRVLSHHNMTLGVSMPESGEPFSFDAVSFPDAANRTGQPEYISRETSGAVLSALHRPSRYVSIDILKQAGVAMERQGQAGMAKLFITCLGAAGKQMSRHELQARLDRYGMDLSTVSGNNTGSIRIKVRNNFIDEALDIASDVLANPISQDDFEKERHQMLSTMSIREQHPVYHMARTIHAHMFRGTPYVNLVDGTTDSIASMTLDDLHAFRERFLAEGSWGIGVCGGIGTAGCESLLESFPADVVGPFTLPDTNLPEPEDEVVPFDARGREQCYLSRVFRIPGIYHDDFDKLNYMRGLFSGQRSILFRELRERTGLVYTYSMDGMGGLIGGYLSINAITSPDKRDTVMQRIDDAVDRVCGGEIDSDLMRETRRRSELNYAISMGKNHYHSFHLAFEKALGFPHLKYQRYPEMARSITEQTVADLASRYFDRGVWFVSDNG